MTINNKKNIFEDLEKYNKDIIQSIIEKSQVKEFVDVIAIDGNEIGYTYEYLNLKYIDNQIVFLKNIHKPILRDYIVSATIPRNIIMEYDKKYNIDTIAMITNVLIEKSSQQLTKEVLATIAKICEYNYVSEYTLMDKFLNILFKTMQIFNKKAKYIKSKKISNGKSLTNMILSLANKIYKNSRIGPGNFAIGSLKSSTILDDYITYETNNTKNGILSSSSNQPYSFGKISNVKIFTNPYMKFDDNRVFVGVKPEIGHSGIKLFISMQDFNIKQIEDGSLNYNICAKIRFSVEPVGNNVNDMYKQIIYNHKNALI